jgi:hypothetical protein
MLNTRALIVGVAIGVMAGGVGFALAQDSSGTPSSPSSPASSSAAPVISTDSGSAEPFIPLEQAEAAGVVPEESEADETDFAAEGVPPGSLVADCRSADPPTTPLHCDAIVAVSEGKLAPGRYSDEQLRSVLGE